MILDQREGRILSSVGWVERGALLVWETEANTTSLLPVDESDYFSLIPGEEDWFAVVHHRRSGGYSVSVRHTEVPGAVPARATVRDGAARLEGDSDAWANVPAAYAGYDPVAVSGERAPYSLLVVDASGALGDVQRLGWFNADAYDLVYQSLGTPVQVPGETIVLIPVQRSSRPVIFDFDAREVVGHVDLAGRHGNPTLRFRAPGELWADDYDTILRFDQHGWVKRDERLLQDAIDGTRAFIGGWSFAADRSLCAVSRPFSGDVVGLDTATFEITSRAEVGGQPLDVAVLSDGRIFARDWKSGRALTGRLEPLDSNGP